MLLRSFLVFALSLELATAAGPLRLATAAPRGTSLHQALLEMRQKWSQAPGGGAALTIFSDGVQGGEADVVFLFPDLSAAGDAAYQKYGAQRDSVMRLFYVGMTRARHTLYICQRESSLAVVI